CELYVGGWRVGRGAGCSIGRRRTGASRGIELCDQRFEVVAIAHGRRRMMCTSAVQERRIQKACKWDNRAKDRDDRRVELRAGCERRWKFSAGKKLPVFQKIGGGMIFRKPARHAQEPLARERSNPAPEVGRFNDRP